MTTASNDKRIMIPRGIRGGRQAFVIISPATGDENSTSGPELPQVMVGVLVHEHRPFVGCHPAEEGMWMRRASLGSSSDEPLHQASQPRKLFRELPLVRYQQAGGGRRVA